MKRKLLILVATALCLCMFPAFAESASVIDTLSGMAQIVPGMTDIAEESPEDETGETQTNDNARERGTWVDAATDERFTLEVYTNEASALAAKGEGYRVQVCNDVLVLSYSLAGEQVEAYRAALAGMIGTGEEEMFVLNTSTRRFHLPICFGVKLMKDTNRRLFTGSRETLTGANYKACGRCRP